MCVGIVGGETETKYDSTNMYKYEKKQNLPKMILFSSTFKFRRLKGHVNF